MLRSQVLWPNLVRIAIDGNGGSGDVLVGEIFEDTPAPDVAQYQTQLRLALQGYEVVSEGLNIPFGE